MRRRGWTKSCPDREGEGVALQNRRQEPSGSAVLNGLTLFFEFFPMLLSNLPLSLSNLSLLRYKIPHYSTRNVTPAIWGCFD